MSAPARYDVIVVGCGGMGSAVLAHLAGRGKRVLGLERFDIPHTMGSSHGINRIIRLAYYEDPSYVPLLVRSYELWRDLEREAGEQLLHITGSIDASDPDGEVFVGSLRSCELHGLEHTVLTGQELSRRFPGYRLPEGHAALLQPEGGFLLSERCIVAHVNQAMAHGAVIHAREQVVEWEPTAGGVRVRTDRGIYEAEQLVLTAGAWNGSMARPLQDLLVPERQVLAWFQPLEPAHFQPDCFAVFNLTVEEGRYYGFPVFGIPGFKVGRYHHLDEVVDPEDMDREPRREDESILRAFTERYFPGANGPVMTLKSCSFTNTPDEHFIIDRLPDAEQVLAVSPCSGHGFKFCSVIGEIVADLVIEGATRHDISLFRLDRFRA
jgi:sarcosine oxidase